MITRRFLSRAGWLALLVSSCPVWALQAPDGPVVLTISGKVTNPNAGQTAAFSMRMIEALPQQTFKTRTPWYAQPVEFTGPLLRDVLAAAGATGTRITALALNDYKTEIPFADIHQHTLVLARLRDGQPMPVRDKGPLFLVYPYDTKRELQTELYYNRSAWQLSRLIVQ